MSFGLYDFLTLVGAIGIFIFGMKVMSDAIQKVAGMKLREILGAMTSNRLFGIFTGLSLTTLIQSSSATTVMLVSFANAGLITLTESIGVVLGANLGTTVTGWLISELEIGAFKISALSLPIVAISLPLLFVPRERWKLVGEVLVGFAILFLGLSFMRDALIGLQNEELLSFIKDINYSGLPPLHQFGVLSLCVGIGIVITLAVQSSSAAMALTLVMTDAGWISFPLAAAIILGENIGTTVTANLAALVGNIHAKRTAFSHTLVNVIGVVWALLLFPFFTEFVADINRTLTGTDPFTDVQAIPRSLAIFHTMFNLINVLLLMNFTSRMARFVIRIMPSRSERDEQFSLDYISNSLLDTPELSVIEARKALSKFGDIVMRGFKYVPLLVTEMDEQRLFKYAKKLEKYEAITDRMEMEITNYLSKASRGELSSGASNSIQTIIGIANYLERIGDIYVEITRSLSHRKKQKAYFTPEMRENVLRLSDMVSRSIDLMMTNLEASKRDLKADEADALYQEIKTCYKSLRKEYIQKIEKGKFQLRSGMYYSDLLAELERIGHHVHSVSETLRAEEDRSATV